MSDISPVEAYSQTVADRVRVQLLAETFVELADTLVAEFDPVDFLHVLATRCVELLDVDAAGLMLADDDARLRFAASSSEKVRILELMELQNEEGPCLDCFRSGEPVLATDLESEAGPIWPRFKRDCLAAGFRSSVALPMRLRDETVGALNLFRTVAHPLSAEHRALGQALADIATIGILQDRGVRRRDLLARQLQSALNTRVVIEQAKGVLVEREQVELDAAFNLLRHVARSRRRLLADVARDIVLGRLDLTDADRVVLRTKN